MYWGGWDYNRGHVRLLPVSPISVNCNCYFCSSLHCRGPILLWCQ